MNIREKLILSFGVIVISMAIVGYTGMTALNKINDSYQVTSKINHFIALQRNMDALIARAVVTIDLKKLLSIKQEINDISLKLKEVSLTTLDDKKSEKVTLLLASLKSNELAMGKLGSDILKIHQDKLEQKSTFVAKYPIEKEQRMVIGEVVYHSKDIQMVIDMGLLQYLSKETLYQYRDQVHLDKWLGLINKIEAALEHSISNLPKDRKEIAINMLYKYRNTAKVMGKIAIASKHLEGLEASKTLEFDTLLNINENKIQAVINHFKEASQTLVTRTYTIQVALIFILVLFAFLISAYISRKMSHSITTLSDGVDKISGGDLDVKIKVETSDEFAKLADSFNNMSTKLKIAQNDLEEHNRDLEKTVSERTEEINQKKEQMEQLAEKLAKYLSPQVYASIFSGEKEVKIETYRKPLTVLFSDIVGFTKTSESMEIFQLTNWLNTYLDAMANIILKFDGTLDKFIGDAVMVFFGDPVSKGLKEDAVRCVNMAIQMVGQAKLQGVNTRIGINTGDCIVGNFGSEQRMDYTIIGKEVNLASRLEGCANEGGILISEATYNLVKDDIDCTKSGPYQLKGIEGGITAYLVNDNSED